MRCFKRNIKKLILLCIIFLFGGVFLAACSTPIAPVNMTADGVAIKGYDPVSYFRVGSAEQGQKDLQYEWRNAKWFFASKEHLELFKSNPVKYAPQYGGY